MKTLSIFLASTIIMIALAVSSNASDIIKHDEGAYKIVKEGEPLEVSITPKTGYNSIKGYEGKIYHCWTEGPADQRPIRCSKLSDDYSFDYKEIWESIINPK